MISAGSDATALVALWITLLMICWKAVGQAVELVAAAWCWMLMSPQIRLLFQPTPTPIERMPAARLMDTALPPPIEYMTSSPITLPLVWRSEPWAIAKPPASTRALSQDGGQ
jgi:hypothetical protein